MSTITCTYNNVYPNTFIFLTLSLVYGGDNKAETSSDMKDNDFTQTRQVTYMYLS